MQGSPYTLLVYKQAFGSDLMRDLVEAYGPSDASALDEDGAWALTGYYEVRYSPAGLRSSEPRASSVGESTTLEVIDSAIAAELFRHEQTGRIKRWISRRLERLAELARAIADRFRA